MQFNIKNLKYFYPGSERTALNVDEFHIEKGEFILVSGPSGSGKTSLARILGGLIPEFYGGKITGEALFNSRTIFKEDKRQLRRNIGLVYQNPEKQIVMNNVEAEIAFGLENIEIESDRIKLTIDQILSDFDMEGFKNTATGNLSSGQKQKLAIASIIAMNPEMIILDEPTSQLDPEASGKIISTLEELNRRLGITVIVIEHRLKDFLRVAGRAILMKEGQIVVDDKPLEYLKIISNDHKDFPLSVSNKTELKPLLRNTIKNNLILKVTDLQFYYDKQVKILNGVNLELNRRELLSITGANGSGKSTLLKLISRVLKPCSGSIKIKEYHKGIMNIGFLSQNPNDYLFNDSVEDELKYTMDNLGIDDPSVMNRVLADFELTEFKKEYPRDLSTGERQRVALASIMVANPPVLLLDEPTRGLDNGLKMKLGRILRNLIETEDISVILVTQDYEFMLEYSDIIKIMSKGQLENYPTKSPEEYFEGRIIG